jgi:E3 ubiquitin-protein ligase AIP2
MPTQCHITLDDFIHGEELLQIRQCKHMFKPPGLRRWLSQHSKCPVCRCDVTLNGIYENTPATPVADEEEEPGDYDDLPELIDDNEEDTHDIMQ